MLVMTIPESPHRAGSALPPSSPWQNSLTGRRPAPQACKSLTPSGGAGLRPAIFGTERFLPRSRNLPTSCRVRLRCACEFLERHVLFGAICLIFAGVLPAQTAPQNSAQNTTTAGEFIAEPPTLVSLGFEWRIVGDDNRNAKVEVSFRKKNEPSWRPALPLLRVHNEQIGVPPAPASGRGGGPAGGGEGAGARYPAFKYTAANMFSGSILNLEADTEYECRFTLSDPDGVTGPKEKIVT